MTEIPIRPATLCMAPWTHTYLSPQTERRMCCASREPARTFQQYIDTKSGSGEYQPQSLEDHWNNEHMRDVRRRMMAGESLPECQVCDDKLLNTAVYRDYFWHLFKHKYQDIWAATDETGHTTMRPVSWDYRFSNLCNFKCRTCGDMLSSAWETEQKAHDMVNWNDPKNAWMQPDVRRKISAFQSSVIEQEFSDAIERHDIEEIYWVGGEPLMFEQHWRYMQRLVSLGDGNKVYARYNTNLSRIDYKGINLYNDILSHLRDWQICASMDGTGLVGQYIRTGLDFDSWCRNFEQGLTHAANRRQMRIDFTLTLPGLFELEAIDRLADRWNVEILAKVIFSFTPDIVMSPLALPRTILERQVQSVMPCLKSPALRELLDQLLRRNTFQEQWPDDWHSSLLKGKNRILQIESIRGDTYTMADILSQDKDIYEWWQNIR